MAGTVTRSAPAESAAAGKRPLHVLHVVTGLGPGGAETVLYRLATYPSTIRHEVLCLTGRDRYSSMLEEKGIVVHHLEWTRVLSSGAAALRLHRFIRSSEADLVQAWMYRANLLAGLSSRIAGKPVVWNIRCSSLYPLRPASRLVAYAGGALARWLPRFIVNCSEQSALLHDGLGYGAAEGAVIPNGYDPREFHPDEDSRSKIRESLGIAPDCFLVGSIGRWHAQKGFPILLKATRLLRDRGIRLRLLLAGRGLDESNAELAALIRGSCAEGLVDLLGERSDIPDIDRALDLHVLASIGSEGFPNVVAETMLSGTPNVATNVGDAELIVGDTGWVVSPSDPVGLADAIEEAHGDWECSPGDWQRRRRNARTRIVDNFSLDRMVRAYEEVWRKVANA